MTGHGPEGAIAHVVPTIKPFQPSACADQLMVPHFEALRQDYHGNFAFV